MNDEKSEQFILDLSKKCLKKVPKQEDAQNCRILILDDNELQKIDNIDSYLRIEKYSSQNMQNIFLQISELFQLSLSKNQLLRMYGVCRLQRLKELNLSFNGILTIEGLKELIHLQHLNLEGNNIKTIEHLNTNTKLVYINLSENSIGSISDISYLKSLKELYLHGNRITHLRQCDKYLPTSLEILTLAKNSITDLNEICTLTHLCNLHSITIGENPCVQMTGGTDGFDHRPFVLNWCMSVKVIDGFMVDPIESLKAEWLFSQGRGRQFRVGEQAALAKYLSSVCPLLGKALENENERKLRLILSKAQQHQRQLQEEISDNLNTSGGNSPSSGRRKQTTSRIQSPRFSRLGPRQGSPESMSNSYHGNISSHSIMSNQNDIHTNQNHMLQMTTSLIENIKNDSIMTQSLDASLTGGNCILNSKVQNSNSLQDSTPKANTPNQYNDQNSVLPLGGPLAAASKMVPVPETLMSPDCCPSSITQKVINTQNLNSNTKVIKNKENKSSSPKINRNSHLRRNSEKSPILSPRKINTVLQSHQNIKLSALDNQEIRARNFQNSVHMTPPDGSGTLSSDDDSDHINVDKLKTIRNKAAQRNQEQKHISPLNLTEDIESSVIMIQKTWRGYKSRKDTKDIAEKLLKKRTIEYIEKLTKDMELTKAQLENERKIQQLQMQAINALWKKVSSMQSASNITAKDASENGSSGDTIRDGSTSTQIISLDNNTTAVVTDLAKTCAMLTNQVQQLQGSMRDILNCMSLFCNLPHESLKKIINEECKDSAGTQTEIVAVHTPQFENQNFLSKVRPSSLPLPSDQSTNVIITNTATNIPSTGNEMLKKQNDDNKIEDSMQIEKNDDIHEQSEKDKMETENPNNLKGEFN